MQSSHSTNWHEVFHLPAHSSHKLLNFYIATLSSLPVEAQKNARRAFDDHAFDVDEGFQTGKHATRLSIGCQHIGTL